MNNDGYLNFLDTWDSIMGIAALAGVGVFILLTIYYFFGAVTKSDPKKKYDFINANEIKLFWRAMLALSVAFGLWLNTVARSTVEQEMIWFFVRFFVTASFTTIFGLIFNSLIKVYYPFYVEKKLNRLRHKPRTNPNNGKKLKLLSEEEEDEYLTDEMIQEEANHAVDYDVWLDEETGYTKIEKYDGNLLAVECPSCGYRTLRITKEEVIRSPTTEEEGELLAHYDCSYCKHKERRTIKTKKLHSKPEVA